MFKRIMMIGMFGMSVVAMLPTAAMTDFWGISVTWKDIDCNAILTGIKPGTHTDNVLICNVTINEVCAECANNSNSAQTAQGKPFALRQVTVGGSTNSFTPLTTHGKVSGTVVINQSDIEHALAPFAGDICQNRNWSIVPGTAQPTNIHVELEIFTGADGTCQTGLEAGCTLDDSVTADCTLACGAPLNTSYSCTCKTGCKLPGGVF